jgi:hypothetical protein
MVSHAMNRYLTFTARDFGAYEQNGALIAGFAKDRRDEASDEALVLQRSTGDLYSGHVSAEIPIQRYAANDAVKKASLSRDRLSIAFYPDAALEMGGIEGMEIAFAATDPEFTNLVSVLRRIFLGHDLFTVEVANQSTDPTLASGTPGAGHHPRLP